MDALPVKEDTGRPMPAPPWPPRRARAPRCRWPTPAATICTPPACWAPHTCWQPARSIGAERSDFEMFDQAPLTDNAPGVTARVTAAFTAALGDEVMIAPPGRQGGPRGAPIQPKFPITSDARRQSRRRCSKVAPIHMSSTPAAPSVIHRGIRTRSAPHWSMPMASRATAPMHSGA